MDRVIDTEKTPTHVKMVLGVEFRHMRTTFEAIQHLTTTEEEQEKEKNG